MYRDMAANKCELAAKKCEKGVACIVFPSPTGYNPQLMIIPALFKLKSH